MKRILFRISTVIILVSLSFAAAFGQSMYGFRGEDRTGIYNETGLLKEWPAKGPSLIWEAEGKGIGYSSATVTNDAVYITGIRDDKDVLTAFNQDGKKKWDVEYGTMLRVQNYPESCCTPTVSNGKIIWKFDFSAVNDDKRGGKNYIQTPIYRDGAFR